MHAPSHAYKHTYTYKHTHAHVHTYAHTYTHIHIDISVREDERDALSELETYCANLLHLTNEDLSEFHAHGQNAEEASNQGSQQTAGGRTYTHTCNEHNNKNKDKETIMQATWSDVQHKFARMYDESVDGDAARKICVLIWAYVCRVKLEGGSLAAEMRGIAQNGIRVLRALFEVCVCACVHVYVCACLCVCLCRVRWEVRRLAAQMRGVAQNGIRVLRTLLEACMCMSIYV
jgi:hypothetical protein